MGIGGLIADMLHPHAGPTGAKFLGLASTWPHNTMLVAFGVVAIVAVGRRRAAVVVTASSAVAYTILLFVTSVATARSRPTPFGFHAADIVLHGVLAVANFALLMWLIPDELGDEVWAPRRPEERSQDQPPPAASEAVEAPAPGSPAPRNGENPRPSGRFWARATNAVLSHRAVVAALLVALVAIAFWMRHR
ncbi:DUF4383 domain-containing protein [Mycobacterium bohemicum]|nr:DUF4383 domain-containing protein [Mycobacterium bohemicum]